MQFVCDYNSSSVSFPNSKLPANIALGGMVRADPPGIVHVILAELILYVSYYHQFWINTPSHG